MRGQLSFSFSFPSPGDEDVVFDAEVSGVLSGNVGIVADVGVSATIGKGKAEQGPAVTGEISVTGKVTAGAASVAVIAPVSRDENTEESTHGTTTTTLGIGGVGITNSGNAERSKAINSFKSPRASRIDLDAMGTISPGCLFDVNDTESSNSNEGKSRKICVNNIDGNSTGEYSGTYFRK